MTERTSKTKYFDDITEGDKKTVIQMYEDAKVKPETNAETIEAIVKATDVWEPIAKNILKKADIYVPSPTPEYQDLETATKNFKPSQYHTYQDVRFRGTVRVFGDTDAWSHCYMNDFEGPKTLLGETFTEFQVRMELMESLDIDTSPDDEDRKPNLRPFDVETSERDYP